MGKQAINQWNAAADLYVESQEKSEFAEANRRIVKHRFIERNGEKVLDVGCGYGYYTDFFQSIGCDVIGCDASENMLSFAKEKYPDCCFEQVDIESALPYSNNCFDLVFCNQVLMDIENLDHLITELYRIAKPSGIFYMSIVHPAFYDGRWVMDENGFKKKKMTERYLSEYSFDNEFWGKTRHYHRNISRYINAALDNGFVLTGLNEPETYDGITKSKEIPLFLFAEFKKSAN